MFNLKFGGFLMLVEVSLLSYSSAAPIGTTETPPDTNHTKVYNAILPLTIFDVKEFYSKANDSIDGTLDLQNVTVMQNPIEQDVTDVDLVENFSEENVSEVADDIDSVESVSDIMIEDIKAKESFPEVVDDINSKESFPEDVDYVNSEESFTEDVDYVNSDEGFTTVFDEVNSDESFTEVVDYVNSEIVDELDTTTETEKNPDDVILMEEANPCDRNMNEFRQIKPMIFVAPKVALTTVKATPNPLEGYKPDPERALKIECFSTGYHKNPVWVVYKQRVNVIASPRKYLKQMRTTLYEKSGPRDCHKSYLTDPVEFLECQIKRQMRMEFGIPNYPNVPK